MSQNLYQPHQPSSSSRNPSFLIINHNPPHPFTNSLHFSSLKTPHHFLPPKSSLTIPNQVISNHITSNQVTSHHTTSHQTKSHHTTSHHPKSHHITSPQVTSHHITPPHTATTSTDGAAANGAGATTSVAGSVHGRCLGLRPFGRHRRLAGIDV